MGAAGKNEKDAVSGADEPQINVSSTPEVPDGPPNSSSSPDESDSTSVYRVLGYTQKEIEESAEAAQQMATEEAFEILQRFVTEHEKDMLIPATKVEAVQSLLDSNSEKLDPVIEEQIKKIAALINHNSVYQEIRTVIDPHDDPSTPCATVRSWTIGLIAAAALAAINQFFAPRQPAIVVTAYLAQLFSFVVGKAAAAVLPTKVFFPDSRFAFTLNPGPYTIKEQTLIAAMANVSFASPRVTLLFFMQRLPNYLGLEWAGSYLYGLCMTLGTQLLGFGLAGICRRFLVYPPNMIWFYILSQVSMNKALFNEGNAEVNGWKITRLKYFSVVFGCFFCYYWIPNTIAPTLTFFNWMTWIKPTSAVLAIVTGTYYFHMGFNPVATFDYNWISILEPLVVPYFIVLQIVIAGAVWGACVILPVFFTNTWYTGYLPPNSWLPYDNTGNVYNTARILDGNQKLNQTAYDEYSPVYIPAAMMLKYAAMLGVLPALVVFTVLWHGSSLLPLFRDLFTRKPQYSGRNDVHSKLMSHYKEIPEWVYLCIGAVAMALGFIGVYAWPTNIPGWLFPLAFVCGGLLIIPIGIVVAVSNFEADLEIMFNIIGGAAVPGDPVGAYMFKVIGKAIIHQAIFFSGDMKMGHYMKVPPWQMMTAQVVATVVASFVTLGIIDYQITGIPGICDPTQQTRFVCSQVASNWTGAIVWGVIGPKKLFGASSMYNKIPLAVLAGVLWPIPWYLGRKRWPHSFLRHCHPIAMLFGSLIWAAMNFSNLFGALPIAWFFGSYVKTRYPDWWAKYTYVTSTAIIAGIALSALVQFFAVGFEGSQMPNWWGTSQYLSTCDLQDCRWLKLAEGEKFGPVGGTT